MAHLRYLFYIYIGLSLLVGCSKVGFTTAPVNFGKFGGECVEQADGSFICEKRFRTGQVDILFVDDNSGSMSTEQAAMASRFPQFMQSLAKLDWQIGITTTDVVNDAGRLLPFSDQGTILTKNTPNAEQLFNDTIKRPETALCDSGGPCPSGDERGIFAANLVMERSPGFFRPGAHFALVILSDEDERSNGGLIPGFPLQTNDLPLTLVENLSKFLGPDKILSVHSIIINEAQQPQGAQCLAIQNAQGNNVKGRYGKEYAKLSTPSAALKAAGNIVDGVIGNICATDYTAQLGDIGDKIGKNVKKQQLACDPSEIIEFTFDPEPVPFPTFNIDSDNRLEITSDIDAGTDIVFKYKCPAGTSFL